jgi:hypothetical protein
MIENSTQHHLNDRPYRTTLSLHDFSYAGKHAIVSDYLSLSFSWQGDDTKISITTTDTYPVTYSAVLSATNPVDLQSLQFVVQCN